MAETPLNHIEAQNTLMPAMEKLSTLLSKELTKDVQGDIKSTVKSTLRLQDEELMGLYKRDTPRVTADQMAQLQKFLSGAEVPKTQGDAGLLNSYISYASGLITAGKNSRGTLGASGIEYTWNSLHGLKTSQ